MNDKLDPQVERDLKLIKENFAENEPLLKDIRSLLIGRPITDKSREQIREIFKNEDLIRIVKNQIYQDSDDDIPAGQMNDFWMNANKIEGMTYEQVQQSIIFRTKVLKLLRQIPIVLKNPELKIELFEPPADENSYDWNLRPDCDILARNLYAKSIDTAMFYLKIRAGTKKETPEETMERLRKDSSK
jgi:hypothetical protein